MKTKVRTPIENLFQINLLLFIYLFKKFIHLLKTADEQTLDLNDAVKDLLV